MKRLLAALILAGTLAASTGGAVFADTTPPPNGQPGASCEDPSTNTRPGAAMSAGGSAFNPDGTAGAHYAGNDGTKSLLHANSANAVSQYDVACFQVSAH